jgi:hypothetical protein
MISSLALHFRRRIGASEIAASQQRCPARLLAPHAPNRKARAGRILRTAPAIDGSGLSRRTGILIDFLCATAT